MNAVTVILKKKKKNSVQKVVQPPVFLRIEEKKVQLCSLAADAPHEYIILTEHWWDGKLFRRYEVPKLKLPMLPMDS